MRIAIDRHIPFIEGVFEPHGIEVSYQSEVSAADADAMIIRTRTRCNATTLAGHHPRIIATATIGFDHIDLDYCHSHNIEVVTAAGCNARGVAQWLFAALLELGIKQPSAHTLGVIGVGNVGSVVARVAHSVGFRVVLCDPPRAARGEAGFVPLEQLLTQSDIVTIHTPLDNTTCGMANADFFARMSSEAIFLNSSRGEVVDQDALMDSSLRRIALDVWCNEPQIDTRLMERVSIATPHIAGYSLQGKAMGTAMSVRSVARALGIDALRDWYPPQVTPTVVNETISWPQMQQQMAHFYDIMSDDHRLRAHVENFEQLRSNYAYRTEFF